MSGALSAETRRAAIERFLRTYSGDWYRREITAAPGPDEAKAFCARQHALGGASFQTGDFAGWIAGTGRPTARGLHVLDSAFHVAEIIPWRDVIRYALGDQQVYAQEEIEFS